MDKLLVSPPSLQFFLMQLNKKFGKYIILRGYEYLPNSYSNDIDVYIPRADLSRFFKCINNLEGIDSKLVILVSRFGLIKCELLLEDEIIPFDIMYGFYYAGLEYQDCSQLFLNSKKHSSGLFFIPHISDETRISILKELLHNGRVRSDKANLILNNIEISHDMLPVDFFHSEDIKNVRTAIFKKEYNLPKLSQNLKINILRNNMRKNSLITLKNILMFVIVKYILKNKYHLRVIDL